MGQQLSLSGQLSESWEGWGSAWRALCFQEEVSCGDGV